jgi:pantoate--beta-alanine ligase
MKTIRSLRELRGELAPARRDGRSIGLVPTMGAFHDGHLSLMRRARAETEIVVVWLFVNPTQFNDSADLAAYPRDEARDAELAAREGVDYLFAPAAEDVYPPGFATTVSIAGLTDTLEGAHRGRAHFDGVTTVVTKMLNMVAPDVAYFGQKDAQQAIVVQRLVRDLDMPVRTAIARPRCTARWSGSGNRCSPASTTPTPPAQPGSSSSARPGSSRTISSSLTPTRSRRCARSTAESSRSWPRRSARRA